MERLAYTDAEVAALLRVSRRTVYRLRKSGALRAIHIGRSVRISRSALADFIGDGARRDVPSPALEAAEIASTQSKRKGNKDAGQSPCIQPQS